MDVMRAGEGEFETGDAGRFTGDVWLRRTVQAPDGTNVAIVCFAPGSRTHWHRHPGGQFLYGVEGRGRVRSRDGRGVVIGPGDVVYVGPDEWHFHGGTQVSPLVHVAVNGGGAPEWGDPVTDEEYAEGF
ncbi:MAG TPA: cupin domain-containing protein [Actinomycetota bacterium]|jgi:quercetin dioxygenase-like cupin family protein|nr:cupin domain-containing protein [Actinomycetota bacterium]